MGPQTYKGLEMERDLHIRVIALDELPDISWRDKHRHNNKPPWLASYRCNCGSRKLRLVYGTEDLLQTPKKIKCLNCKYETLFWLTKDQVINQFERDKND